MDNSKIWDKILAEIKDSISPANFRTWFSQTRIERITETELVIIVPSAFIKSQLATRYQTLLIESAKKVTEKDLLIQYQIDSTLVAKPSVSDEPEEFIFNPSPISTTVQSPLNPKYNLDNFVVGLTNNLAYAAGQAVVQNPGISYNPLFIYGPSGVGKTHLMQGIGNALVKRDPSLRLIFATSERFMNDLVESIQTKRTNDFRRKYRSCDLLMIDDIQFISGKDSTQEEFFHTYNELHSRNTQIILTSDRPPNEMAKLESRLLSRFQGGLMVDIQLPDFDTRMAILKAKLKERGESLPEDILKLIAETVTSNTRELEGKLIQMLQMSKLNNQPVDLALATRFLGAPSITSHQLDSKKVLSTINQYFNIKMSDLTGPRRQKELVLPRHIAMYILYEDCRIPMEKIGDILGGRDHTTILHGIEKIRQELTNNQNVKKLVSELKGFF